MVELFFMILLFGFQKSNEFDGSTAGYCFAMLINPRQLAHF